MRSLTRKHIRKRNPDTPPQVGLTWAVSFDDTTLNKGETAGLNVTVALNSYVPAPGEFAYITLTTITAADYLAAGFAETQATSSNCLAAGYTTQIKTVIEALGGTGEIVQVNGINAVVLGFKLDTFLTVELSRLSVQGSSDTGDMRLVHTILAPSSGTITAAQASVVFADVYEEPVGVDLATIELTNDYVTILGPARAQPNGTEIGRFVFRDIGGNVLNPGAAALEFVTGGDVSGRFAIQDAGSGTDRYKLVHTTVPADFEDLAPVTNPGQLLRYTITVEGQIGAGTPVTQSLALYKNYLLPAVTGGAGGTVVEFDRADGAATGFKEIVNANVNSRIITPADSVLGSVLRKSTYTGDVISTASNVTWDLSGGIALSLRKGFILRKGNNIHIKRGILAVGTADATPTAKKDLDNFEFGTGGGPPDWLENILVEETVILASNDELGRVKHRARGVHFLRCLFAYPFYPANHTKTIVHNHGPAASDRCGNVTAQLCAMWFMDTRAWQVQSVFGFTQVNCLSGGWKDDQAAIRFVGSRDTLAEAEPADGQALGNLFVLAADTAARRSGTIELLKIQGAISHIHVPETGDYVNHFCKPGTDNFTADPVTRANGSLTLTSCSGSDALKDSANFTVQGLTVLPTATEQNRRDLFLDIVNNCGDPDVAITQDLRADMLAGVGEETVSPTEFEALYGTPNAQGVRWTGTGASMGHGIVGDVAPATSPEWVTSGTMSVLAGQKLHQELVVTGTGAVTIGPFEGDDVAQIEVRANYLEWEGADVRHDDDPQDSNANNVYTGSVSATEDGGNVAILSCSVTVMPNPNRPDQITDLSVTVDGDEATLVFTDNPEADYHEYQLDGGAPVQVPIDKTLTGFDPGSAHSVIVRPVQTINYGKWTDPEPFTLEFDPPLDLITHTAEDEVDRNTYDFAAANVGASSSGVFAKTGLVVHVFTRLAGVNHQHGTLRVTPQGSAEGVGATTGTRRVQTIGAITCSIWTVPYTDDDLPNIRLICRDNGDTVNQIVNQARIVVRPIFGRSLTPSATYSDTTAPVSQDFILPESGFAVASAMSSGSTDETCTWSAGVEKETDNIISSMQSSVAYFETHTDGGETKTIAPTWSGAPATQRMVGAVFGAASAAATGVTAVHSDAVVDIIGINGHLNWDTNTAVWRYATRAAWLTEFGELGVRYMRTNHEEQLTQTRNYMNLLHNDYGTTFMLNSNRLSNTETQVYNHAPMLSDVDKSVPFADQILGFEGPNEVNNDNGGVGATGYATRTVAYCQALQTRIRSHPEFDDKVILSCSAYGRSDAARDELGAAGIGATYDDNNEHWYTNGMKPSQGNPPIVGNQYGGTGTIALEQGMHYARTNKPAGKLWITECGYKSTDTDTPASIQVMTQREQAAQMLRLILEVFRRRAPGTAGPASLDQYMQKMFIYTLMDDIADASNFGILKPNFTGTVAGNNVVLTSVTKRTSYTALKNFITLMADPGVLASPDSLNFTLTGNLTDVRAILFQKIAGEFILALWLDGVTHNRSSPFQDLNPSRPLTVDFGLVPSLLRSALPISAGVWSGETEGQTLAVTVPDSVLLLEITT